MRNDAIKYDEAERIEKNIANSQIENGTRQIEKFDRCHSENV